MAQDNPPLQRQNLDYMSTFLSRNTNPLGLEEDEGLKRMRNEAAITWVRRAGWRHPLK